MFDLVCMAILGALAIGQSAPAADVPVNSNWAIGVTGLCVMLPILMAVLATVRAGRSQRPSDRWLRGHFLIWAGCSLTMIYVAQWPDFVHARWMSDDWILMDQLAILTPLGLSWLGSRWMLFDRAGDCRQPASRRWRFAISQARLTIPLAWGPILLFSVLHDVMQPWCGALGETRLPLVTFVINGLLLLTGMPVLLTFAWRATPLPSSPLRECLEQFASRRRVRLQEILFWPTPARRANAVVCGIWPATRRIFLSDGLLTDFSEEDIEAVFAHELGHVAHRHLLWRFTLLFLPGSLSIWSVRFFHLNEVDAGLVTPIAVLATVAYLLVALGWYSRRLEHQADLWACRELAQDRSKAAALQQYLSILWRLERQHAYRGSWLHPSYQQRRDFLVSSFTTRHHAAAFQSEMRWLAGLWTALAVLPLMAG